MGLKVINLSYIYDQTPIFSNLNFNVLSGEALQVIGRNGQGKTTLLRVLAGLLLPLQGQIFWQGRCVKTHAEAYCFDMIYLGHLLGFKPYLTAKENLLLSIRLIGHDIQMDHLFHVFDQVGLEEQMNQMTYQLSEGQRQRLALARLVASQSRLWILDEPFNVLCQQGQQLMKKQIVKHLNGGGSLIFTAHHPVCLDEISVRELAL